MAFLTDLLKQVFTTTATGAVALRAIISGDQNLGGNFAPTAAEVKDLISGNIPFKWQYGSQTNLYLRNHMVR
jgi:hypothetical protein